MGSIEKYRTLAQRVGLFQGLSPEDVGKIVAKGTTMRVAKGEVIFQQRTTGNTMFVILGGKVALSDDTKHLATLGSGDMFGEMALISEQARSATAIAAEDTRLFVLSEAVFHKLMTKRVAIQILLNIIGTLSKRLREANRKMGIFEGA